MLEQYFYLLTKTEKRWIDNLPEVDVLLFFFYHISVMDSLSALKIGYNFFSHGNISYSVSSAIGALLQ